MFYKITSILIVFLFVGSSILEVHEINLSNENTQISSIEKEHFAGQSAKILGNSHCNDCQNDTCPDAGGCSLCICTCLSSFFIESKSSISCISKPISTKIEWYFYSNYRSPFLDPALKPPLFS